LSASNAAVAEIPAGLDRSELNRTLGFRLREAWQEMERDFLERFREEKITPALYAILILVDANPGCRPSDLCREVSISPTNIVPYIEDLVQRGLMLREGGVRDRRMKHLTLTTRGRDYLNELRALHKAVDRDFLDKLGADNMAKLVELLARITG
jgi:DNA-binding MarR family transcriptional regulator